MTANSGLSSGSPTVASPSPTATYSLDMDGLQKALFNAMDSFSKRGAIRLQHEQTVKIHNDRTQEHDKLKRMHPDYPSLAETVQQRLDDSESQLKKQKADLEEARKNSVKAIASFAAMLGPVLKAYSSSSPAEEAARAQVTEKAIEEAVKKAMAECSKELKNELQVPQTAIDEAVKNAMARSAQELKRELVSEFQAPRKALEESVNQATAKTTEELAQQQSWIERVESLVETHKRQAKESLETRMSTVLEQQRSLKQSHDNLAARVKSQARATASPPVSQAPHPDSSLLKQKVDEIYQKQSNLSGRVSYLEEKEKITEHTLSQIDVDEIAHLAEALSSSLPQLKNNDRKRTEEMRNLAATFDGIRKECIAATQRVEEAEQQAVKYKKAQDKMVTAVGQLLNELGVQLNNVETRVKSLETAETKGTKQAATTESQALEAMTILSDTLRREIDTLRERNQAATDENTRLAAQVQRQDETITQLRWSVLDPNRPGDQSLVFRVRELEKRQLVQPTGAKDDYEAMQAQMESVLEKVKEEGQTTASLKLQVEVLDSRYHSLTTRELAGELLTHLRAHSTQYPVESRVSSLEAWQQQAAVRQREALQRHAQLEQRQLALEAKLAATANGDEPITKKRKLNGSESSPKMNGSYTR